MRKRKQTRKYTTYKQHSKVRRIEDQLGVPFLGDINDREQVDDFLDKYSLRADDSYHTEHLNYAWYEGEDMWED